MSLLLADRFPTALAPVLAAVDTGGRLVLLSFLGRDASEDAVDAQLARCAGAPDARRFDAPACAAVRRALERFLAGRETRLDLPLAPRGTPFQHAVWDELRRIPYGSTASYAEIARRIGRPSAVRAVARANATNPISIAIPCHRVIGSDGSLTGYAGGIEVKRALLELERRVAAQSAELADASTSRSLTPDPPAPREAHSGSHGGGNPRGSPLGQR